MQPFTETVSTLTRHTGEITRMIDSQSKSKPVASETVRDEILHTDSSKHRSITRFVTTPSISSNSLRNLSQSPAYGNPTSFSMDYSAPGTTASMSSSSNTRESTAVSTEERLSFLNRIKGMNKNTLNVKRCIVGEGLSDILYDVVLLCVDGFEIYCVLIWSFPFHAIHRAMME